MKLKKLGFLEIHLEFLKLFGVFDNLLGFIGINFWCLLGVKVTSQFIRG